jgi:D-beta-D-heptose 7-phosphate kinase/D-beta-D-heptose 1-phosphate adenosyltransferase
MLDIWSDYFHLKQSPETGSPVIKFVGETSSPGGAANAARILSILSTVPPILIGIVGTDQEGTRLRESIEKYKIKKFLFSDNSFKTVVKNRIRVHGIELARIDREEFFTSKDNLNKQILAVLTSLERIDAILLSDYNKGLINRDLVERVIKFANETNTPIIADPAFGRIPLFEGCTIIKPNLLCFSDFKNRQLAITDGDFCNVLIVTKGEKGIEYYKNSIWKSLPSYQGAISLDVTGAGDAFSAALALMLGEGESIENALDFAIIISALQVSVEKNNIINWELINSHLKSGKKEFFGKSK